MTATYESNRPAQLLYPHTPRAHAHAPARGGPTAAAGLRGCCLKGYHTVDDTLHLEILRVRCPQRRHRWADCLEFRCVTERQLTEPPGQQFVSGTWACLDKQTGLNRLIIGFNCLQQMSYRRDSVSDVKCRIEWHDKRCIYRDNVYNIHPWCNAWCIMHRHWLELSLCQYIGVLKKKSGKPVNNWRKFWLDP